RENTRAYNGQSAAEIGQQKQNHDRGLSSGRRFELQGDTIHAVAKARRLWAIVEDVTKVASTTAAMDGCPYHAQRRVLCRADRPFQRCPEAWPPRTAVKFRGRGEQIAVTASADECAAPLLVQKRARERTLGIALTQHRILIRRKKFAPIRVAVSDFKDFCGRCQSGPPWREADRRQADRSASQQKASRHHQADLLIKHARAHVASIITRENGISLRD